MDGKAPSDRYHSYYGKNTAPLINYILLPDEDYRQILSPTSLLKSNKSDFNFDKGTFICGIYLGFDSSWGVIYKFTNNLKKFTIITNDDYVRLRDLYVKKGLLKPPLTDTQAYRNLLISQILYWNGNDFVRKNKLK
jgi:hypothetical protein